MWISVWIDCAIRRDLLTGIFAPARFAACPPEGPAADFLPAREGVVVPRALALSRRISVRRRTSAGRRESGQRRTLRTVAPPARGSIVRRWRWDRSSHMDPRPGAGREGHALLARPVLRSARPAPAQGGGPDQAATASGPSSPAAAPSRSRSNPQAADRHRRTGGGAADQPSGRSPWKGDMKAVAPFRLDSQGPGRRRGGVQKPRRFLVPEPTRLRRRQERPSKARCDGSAVPRT